MNLASLLIRAGRSEGDRTAIAIGDRPVVSYAGLARRSAILGRALRQQFGLEPGARVAIAMKNCPQFMEVLNACWWAGLAAVPMNAKLHGREFRYILEDSAATALFATDKLADEIAAHAEGLESLREIVRVEAEGYERLMQGEPMEPDLADADSLAWLFYTSGTTGRPKGAMLSHRNLMMMTYCYFSDVDSVTAGDAILHAAPMSHGSGLYALSHIAAAGVQVVPESDGFDAAEIFSLLPACQGLAMFAAPTMVKRLVEAPEAGEADITNLKTIIYGGGPMYVEDLKRGIECFGQRFVQIYGQGESPMTISSLTRAHHGETDHPRYEARLGSVGRAMMGVGLLIADEDGKPLPPGETGEVVVSGDQVMLGYWNNPEETRETIRDGWLHTGDVGALDEDGFLTLKDRSKDVIISGGTNIYPREVEEVLLRHPAVLECSVIGKPHPEWGEEVAAFVVARDGSDVGRDDLNSLCLSEIARFKRPKAYYFVEELPKNNYGKVLKTELRKRFDEDR